MASVKRVEYKSGRVVYRIVICQGYDKKGNKLVKNLTYSVNQSATPKQQEREAKKYAMDMEDKLKYGYDYNAEKMSFEDFAYKWLESVKDNIAYGTYAGYKQVLESRIIPYFKGDKVAYIKTPHIEAFYRTLVDDYSTGTIKRFANVLNLIFKTAKRYSMIENNPCQDAQKAKRKDEETGLKFFTPKQALMFMKSLDMSYEVTYKGHQRVDDTGKPYYVNEYTESYTVPTQYKVFFTLSLFCGFRKGDDDDKIRLNQRKPSKYKGLSRFGPEKNLQRINKFMKERPTFYKKLIQMKENFRFYLRCFYCITKVVILQFNSEKQDRISS